MYEMGMRVRVGVRVLERMTVLGVDWDWIGVGCMGSKGSEGFEWV